MNGTCSTHETVKNCKFSFNLDIWRDAVTYEHSNDPLRFKKIEQYIRVVQVKHRQGSRNIYNINLTTTTAPQ
jgi:hypothetical protein